MKKKRYILTEEQAKESKLGIVWLIISCVLGVVLSILSVNVGMFEKEQIIYLIPMLWGMILTFFHFRQMFSKICLHSGIAALVANHLFRRHEYFRVIVMFIVGYLTYLLIAIPTLLIGWLILLADIVMLIIRRPLVYQKLEFEYIDDGNTTE